MHVDHLHSAEELAETLRTTERKVLDWTRRYGWPHVKIGRHILFTEQHLESILRMHTVTPPGDATRALSEATGMTLRSAAHHLRTRGR